MLILFYEIVTFCKLYTSILFLCCNAEIPTLHTISFSIYNLFANMKICRCEGITFYFLLVYQIYSDLGGQIIKYISKNRKSISLDIIVIAVVRQAL